MSGQRLPVQIAPFKLARQGQTLQGIIELKGMERLAQALSDSGGNVSVELHFGIDEQGCHYVRGHLVCEVQMICQRCMNPLTIPIEVDVSLAFVSSDEEAGQLPGIYEPYVVADEPIALADIIEDELILALPIVALHADQACQPQIKAEEAGANESTQMETRPNPFAVLSELKRQRQK
jgi:uncharacterized protein